MDVIEAQHTLLRQKLSNLALDLALGNIKGKAAAEALKALAEDVGNLGQPWWDDPQDPQPSRQVDNPQLTLEDLGNGQQP